MMIAIDIGNTHIVTAVFSADEVVAHFRFDSAVKKTASGDFAPAFKAFIASNGVTPDTLEGVVISSVVPGVLHQVRQVCQTYLGAEPLVVDVSTDTGITNRYDQPEHTGVDRIVNAAAAFDRYKRDVIVIDFGTATTIDYVSAAAEFAGGAIVPGIGICADALFRKTSQLPRIELICPDRVIATDTVSGIQAGIVLGYACLVDGMVEKMKREAGASPPVVATGGFSALIAEHAGSIDEVDKTLTLKGLNLVFKRNRSSLSGKSQNNQI